MNRTIKSCTFITFFWVIVLFILRVIQIQADFSYTIQPVNKILTAIFYYLLTAIATIMWISLIKKKQLRENSVSNALFYYYLMVASAACIQAFSDTIRYDLGKLQTTITDSVHFFILSSGLALTIFILEVFSDGLNKEENRKIVFIIAIIFVIGGISLTRMKLFETNRIEINITMGLSYAIILFLYSILSYKSFTLKKKVETEVHKTAFLYIGLSGIVIILAFIGIIIFNALDKQYEFISLLNAIFFLIGYFTLYYGFLELRKGSIKK